MIGLIQRSLFCGPQEGHFRLENCNFGFSMTIWVILEWPFFLGPFLNISQCESFLKNDIRFLVYRETI